MSARPNLHGQPGLSRCATPPCSHPLQERCARAEQEWARKPAAQRTAAAAQQVCSSADHSTTAVPSPAQHGLLLGCCLKRFIVNGWLPCLPCVQIGQECGITSGKWMVRTTPDDEAVVWAAVARAVYVEVKFYASI